MEFHIWINTEGQIHHIQENSMQALNIKRCGKEEVFIDEGAVSRKTNFSYWKKI
ncbi:hypothetical protein [Chryseobacterium sp. 7]|uniref:hypothetical protein n=1 Tax=Chryseobacterium sp. 7 TaxID=2035214 RepID=UPI0016046EBC|nr:hypothetical protein [Chryseobacterium sp. 7]